jgi:hypothetical protein
MGLEFRCADRKSALPSNQQSDAGSRGWQRLANDKRIANFLGQGSLLVLYAVVSDAARLPHLTAFPQFALGAPSSDACNHGLGPGRIFENLPGIFFSPSGDRFVSPDRLRGDQQNCGARN